MATVVSLCVLVSSDVRQNLCVAVFHHELVTFSLDLCCLLSLSEDEFLVRVCGSAVSQTDDWSHTLLTGFMGVRPEPV